ncbi:hypothetical protein BHYA_0033g00460 [Botrytis hyacinthi]|uniref:Uncharacterized protein n=1 Tax=Botrytis hyacinthi TaxID=278943 RepID=A0A4Z1GZ70_9HELO|nr:hypothetical protein BHYA_0033g00460 [Botrytis hyacinthi]
MKFRYIFLVAILATLSLIRVISGPRHDQEETFQLSKRLTEVEVNINTVRTAQYGQRILTQGLDTYVAIIAVGTPGIVGGVAKVMAYISTNSTNVMQDWYTQVHFSGMIDIVICMSQPDSSRNLNPTPSRVQQMAFSINEDYDTVYWLLVSTGLVIHNFNIWVRDQAHILITAGFAMYQRLNKDTESSTPGLGEMEPSTTGYVIADTHIL